LEADDDDDGNEKKERNKKKPRTSMREQETFRPDQLNCRSLSVIQVQLNRRDRGEEKLAQKSS
jgi:hypothetical protein